MVPLPIFHHQALKATESGGNCGIPTTKLLAGISSKLRVPVDSIDLKMIEATGVITLVAIDGVECCFERSLFEAEHRIAKRIIVLADGVCVSLLSSIFFPSSSLSASSFLLVCVLVQLFFEVRLQAVGHCHGRLLHFHSRSSRPYYYHTLGVLSFDLACFAICSVLLNVGVLPSKATMGTSAWCRAR